MLINEQNVVKYQSLFYITNSIINSNLQSIKKGKLSPDDKRLIDDLLNTRLSLLNSISQFKQKKNRPL